MSPLCKWMPLTLALAFQAATATAAQPAEAARPTGWRLRRPSIEARKPLTPVPLLVERLGSRSFAERAAATRELARSGAAGVGPLRDAAVSDNPEVSIRALMALENLWLRAIDSDDGPTAAAALSSLDELSVTGDPSQRARIESLLTVYSDRIESFAINEIRRLGGGIRYQEGIDIVNDDGSIRRQVQFVVIGTKWTGGEQGLRFIRRIRPAGRLGVYFVRGNTLPEGSVERFKDQIASDAGTSIEVQERGAFLGVSSDGFQPPGEKGALVGRQMPADSPAAKAGIHPGDLIVGFNGREVEKFEDLIEELMKLRPGQTVDAAVIRNGERVPLKVTVEEWR